jgi:hypothetical protein
MSTLSPDVLAHMAERLAVLDQDTVERVLNNRDTTEYDLQCILGVRHEIMRRIEGVMNEDDPALELSMAEFEDHSARILGLPELTTMLAEYGQLKLIRDRIIQSIAVRTQDLFVAQAGDVPEVATELTVEPDVLTPPGTLPQVIAPGSGRGIMSPEFGERLTTLLCLLYDLNIDPADHTQVQVHLGPVSENMMRELTYTSVYIPSLQRLVELCNQVGNRSFVWQTNDPADVQRFGAMTKQQKDDYLAEHFEEGASLIMRQGWEGAMRAFLTEPFTVTELQPNQPAPSGTPPITIPSRLARDITDRAALMAELRTALEAAGVCSIVETPREGQTPLRTLMWHKTTSPNLFRPFTHSKNKLSTLLGMATGVSNGSIAYQSFPNAARAIRTLFVGMYNEEQDPNLILGTKQDQEFRDANVEQQRKILREALKTSGICFVDNSLSDQGQVLAILKWQTSFSPQQALPGYKTKLSVQLGIIEGISGKASYGSFLKAVPAIRSLYQNMFDQEIDEENITQRQTLDTHDLAFIIANPEAKKLLLRNALETAGVCCIKEIPQSDGKPSIRTLTWLKFISPQKKLSGFSSLPNVLLGQVMGVSGAAYLSFHSAIPAIRTLYEGMYDIEQGDNSDMVFEIAAMDQRRKILRTGLEAAGVCNIVETPQPDDQLPIRTFTWHKTISPNTPLPGYTTNLNILLGQITNLGGARKYGSFPTALPAIRSLYEGLYDQEEGLEKLLKD